MNSSFEINLIIISGLCLVFWLFFLKLTYGIKTAIGGGACDNDYLLRATARSNEWRWPSDMHIKTYTGTSTSQRDTTVLLLLLFQRLFRDKKGEYPLIALFGFAHIASAFLIYLIGVSYWDPKVSLFISILYLSSFWIWQMSLFVGHLNVGTMFFLLSVYLTTLTITAGTAMIFIWLFCAGIFFCCMLFASSSSPRYLLTFFAALFFVHYEKIGNVFSMIKDNESFLFSLIITISFFIFLIFIKTFYKKIIVAIYERRAWIFNGLISAKKYPLEHYLNKAGGALPDVLRWIIKPYIFLFIIVNLIGFNYFIPVFLGFITVTLLLTLPNIKRSLTFYFNYLYISYIKPGINSGLVRYVKYGYFTRNNLPIPTILRGGGFWWVPKIYIRMAPFHTLIYLATITILIFMALANFIDKTILVFIIGTSILPIFWAEYTKAYQVARSYSSGILGFMVLIGYGAFTLQQYPLFWPIAYILLTITIIWNAWKFFAVIYPARMSFNIIIRTLEKLKIQEIYTYNTFYNDSFLDNVRTSPHLHNLKINLINYIKDVPNGWILIPATTHKAGYIRQEESIEQGDFTTDPTLNELLETKRIEKIATAKFQTVYGSDDIWIQENDITSYLDLMLHYITEKDRFRGYAWLLHSDKLKSNLIK